jgi:hypothetical protein
MAHPLCDALLQIHGAVGAAALTGFLFSDRTDGIISALKGIEDTRTELRRRIVNELGEGLQPVFRDPYEPSPILGADGGQIDRSTYSERPTNPLSSEAFKEAVRVFVDESDGALLDYRSLSIACLGWCNWSAWASRILLALVVWQAVCFGTLLFDKYGSYSLPDWLIIVGSTLSVVIASAAVTATFFRMFHYARVARLRLTHGEL